MAVRCSMTNKFLVPLSISSFLQKWMNGFAVYVSFLNAWASILLSSLLLSLAEVAGKNWPFENKFEAMGIWVEIVIPVQRIESIPVALFVLFPFYYFYSLAFCQKINSIRSCNRIRSLILYCHVMSINASWISFNPILFVRFVFSVLCVCMCIVAFFHLSDLLNAEQSELNEYIVVVIRIGNRFIFLFLLFGFVYWHQIQVKSFMKLYNKKQQNSWYTN